MAHSPQRNRETAERLVRKLDPSYKQRWEVYDGILRRFTGHGARWLDGGCGKNIAIEEFPSDITIGLDIYRHPEVLHTAPVHFVIGDIRILPFRDDAFTLVTLNTVVEHFDNPAAVFSEIRRVLVPGGHVLIHTTNRHSPLILLGKLVPEPLRLLLMKKGFGAQERDVFRAYHRLNTIGAFSSVEGFELVERHVIQDLNWSNRPVFMALLLFHLITRLPGLWRLRTNIVALLRKKAE
ncbi:class I SAM-dependent methyltransferase [bacterium]|nr:class I SAM-dependent methyltransferase [bacterium]